MTVMCLRAGPRIQKDLGFISMFLGTGAAQYVTEAIEDAGSSTYY